MEKQNNTRRKRTTTRTTEDRTFELTEGVSLSPINPTKTPRLLTYGEASDLTGWALGTLYAMVARKQIDHVRLGPRSVRFRLEDIERLIRDGYRAKA
jgi:excisionase family DNA binding protein